MFGGSIVIYQQSKLLPAFVSLASLLLPVCYTSAQGVGGRSVLRSLNASSEEIADLEQGGILVLDSRAYESTPRDLAADAVVLIDVDLNDVMSHFESSISFVPNKEMLAHAEIYSDEDFGGIEYTSDDYEEVRRLINAKRGKDFNLSDSEYALIKRDLSGLKNAGQAEQIKAASDLMRKLLLARYHAYRDGGLDAIAPYSRSSRKTVSAGAELRLTSETFKPFEKDFPGYYHVMVGYPEADDCCKHEFRWLKVKLRGRPTFALAHTMYQLTPTFLLITERFFYMSSQGNSLQLTFAWLPYDDDTYMGMSISANADILDSLLGRMLKKLGRNYAREFVEDALTDVKTDLESP